MRRVELALGTAQFGMKYGIAGRGEAVPAGEVRAVLAAAWECGIRVIDTAPVYGDIEERLDALAQDYAFEVVSKVPALPDQRSSDGIAAFVAEAIRQSRNRLGRRLNTILFHRGEDLLGSHAEVAWHSAIEAIAGTRIKLGVSCYSPEDVAAVRAKYPIAVAQVPGNAFDQRLASVSGMDGVEVHLRSVFLQGLLLMSANDGSLRLPRAKAAMTAWEGWCDERGITPLQAALSIVKQLPVRYCLVGVDRQAHLEEIVAAWECAEPIEAPFLASGDRHVIDPRCW